jgi:hypothetical protein
VAPVDAVEIANGQGALGCQLKMVVASKNFHARDYRFYSATARRLKQQRLEMLMKRFSHLFHHFTVY